MAKLVRFQSLATKSYPFQARTTVMTSSSTIFTQSLCGTSTCSWRKGIFALSVETVGSLETYPRHFHLQAKANDPRGLLT